MTTLTDIRVAAARMRDAIKAGDATRIEAASLTLRHLQRQIEDGPTSALWHVADVARLLGVAAGDALARREAMHVREVARVRGDLVSTRPALARVIQERDEALALLADLRQMGVAS